MKKLHLVCNAHIDPVWLWQWEEGAAETLSTFRVAADFCESNRGFVFNHNEALLYRWIEEYEPPLFARIQKLVEKGSWHIMGGWYLQPDCNLPSGESFVRQILAGKLYFKKKFGVEPTTAINFDSFGHSRGLVQILKKSGYDSYLFCRPQEYPLPSDDFLWIGYDGSEIMAHKAADHYLSQRGKAREKIEGWLARNTAKDEGILLWGIGNHGGGPSAEDLRDIQSLMDEKPNRSILHSTPEAYFAGLAPKRCELPRHTADLNPYDIGCYTSQIRVKQMHRRLENALYQTEKTAAGAALQGLVSYPKNEFAQVVEDLLLSEFHDALPGSSIQAVEEDTLRLMDHGLEILSRIRMRSFMALAGGQEKATEGSIPILIYNPHPYPIEGIFECEFQLPDQNWEEGFTIPEMHQGSAQLPCQAEKERSNLSLDWRKLVVFRAKLEPSAMNRFECRTRLIPKKPKPDTRKENGIYCFATPELSVAIDCATGLMRHYRAGGNDFLLPGSMAPIVMEDDDDSWAMRVRGFPKTAGRFALLSPKESARFSGVSAETLEPVRIIEDGPVRTVVEALFGYGRSRICQRYILPKKGTRIEVESRVYWGEISKMLKLSIPTPLEDTEYVGQVVYGIGTLPNNGDEAVSQKWSALVSRKNGQALACINQGIYGSDCRDGELRISLLRSPGYAAHPIQDRPILEQDRFSPRMDQGERIFHFTLNGGYYPDMLESLDRDALAFNEKPYALSFFPSGNGKKPLPSLTIEDDSIVLTAFKAAEEADGYVIRLFEPTGKERDTVLRIPSLGIREPVAFKPFEIRTLKVDPKTRTVAYTDLLEREI